MFPQLLLAVLLQFKLLLIGANRTDFNAKELLINYGDCLALFENQEQKNRYEHMEKCIDGLEEVYGPIVPFRTIKNILQSPLNPADNKELFESCVIEYPRGQVTLTAIDFMERFVEKAQLLIDNHLKQSSYETLACVQLHVARRFMCNVKEQCAKTKTEQKQVELVYVIGYSLFQLVFGTNQKLNCSTNNSDVWLGQLDSSIWSSTQFNLNSRLFEANDQICVDQKSATKLDSSVGNLRQMYSSYRKLVNLLAKL